MESDGSYKKTGFLSAVYGFLALLGHCTVLCGSFVTDVL